MKVAVITDTHFGARSDSQAFSDFFYKFWTNTFFPYLKEHKIDTIIHSGDLMDRRKYVNYDTLNRMRKEFIDEMERKEAEKKQKRELKKTEKQGVLKKGSENNLAKFML